MILCQVYHCLSRLREIHKRSTNRRVIKIDDKCIKNLKLMIYSLITKNNIIYLNMMVYRKLTHVYILDSCTL